MARNRMPLPDSTGIKSDDYAEVDFDDVKMVSKEAICLVIDGDGTWIPRRCFLEAPDVFDGAGTAHIRMSMAHEKGLI